MVCVRCRRWEPVDDTDLCVSCTAWWHLNIRRSMKRARRRRRLQRQE